MDVLEDFLEDCNSADRIAAHNMDFNLKIVLSEL